MFAFTERSDRYAATYDWSAVFEVHCPAMARCLVFWAVKGIEGIKDIDRALRLVLDEALFRSYLYSLVSQLYCIDGLDEGNDSKIGTSLFIFTRCRPMFLTSYDWIPGRSAAKRLDNVNKIFGTCTLALPAGSWRGLEL